MRDTYKRNSHGWQKCRGKICERLNLPNCVGPDVKENHGNTEGGIPEKIEETGPGTPYAYTGSILKDTEHRKKEKVAFTPLLWLPPGEDNFQLMSEVKSNMLPHRQKPKQYFVMMIKNMYYVNYQNEMIALIHEYQINIWYERFLLVINVTK